jgi:hypothetical protein
MQSFPLRKKFTNLFSRESLAAGPASRLPPAHAQFPLLSQRLHQLARSFRAGFFPFSTRCKRSNLFRASRTASNALLADSAYSAQASQKTD